MTISKTFGEIYPEAKRQLDTCLQTVGEGLGVLCGDHHVGYGCPIGGVVATQNVILPAVIGYDVGCGNLAVRTNLKWTPDFPLVDVMDRIAAEVAFGVGRNRSGAIDLDQWSVFTAIRESIPEQKRLLPIAQNQFGTVGAGNHYVDLFVEDATGDIWIGVHFGSRGFGHKTASGFLAVAKGLPFDAKVNDGGMFDAPDVLSMHSGAGQDYLKAMSVAGLYAYQGREFVVQQVLNILGAETVGEPVHNHHNYAWVETHFGQEWLVGRKGATPAFPGQKGFVGSSMGETSVILEGVDSPDSALALYSTMHGAGRARGRRSATKGDAHWVCPMADELVTVRAINQACPGTFANTAVPKNQKCPVHDVALRKELVRPPVNFRTVQDAIRVKGIELRGAGPDESPECYKRLPEVLAAHAGTIRVLHELRPIGVAMAGRDVVDPFRD